MKLNEIFKKQGGVKLIKQYMSSGVLWTAICVFLLLGKSRTALEILRLSTHLKLKQRVFKRYRNKIREYDSKYNNNYKNDRKKVIWICWLQGIEKAPNIVKSCYASIVNNVKDREVVLITQNNIREYISFPNYIQQKIDKGIIKNAHLTDLLRLELLTTYGGTWIDATVFCSSSNIPSYMLDSELFMFQDLKPGRDGHTNIISNWFITAYPNNKLLYLEKHLLYDYWKTHNKVIDYYIFHIFFSILIDLYPEEWTKVIPFSNSSPHILLLRLFENYNDELWNAIKNETPFHKLSYKHSKADELKENTFYDIIIRNYCKDA